MSVPAWLLDIFAAVMLAVAAVSAARLAIARRAGRRSDPDADIDVSHLLMGLAMAGTLAASLSTLPSGAWEVIFGALTAWFAYRVAREYRGRGLRALVSEHHAPHLLHSAAMLYMFLALRTVAPGHSTAMAGMSAAAASPCACPPWPCCSPSSSAPTSSPTWTGSPPRPPSPASTYRPQPRPWPWPACPASAGAPAPTHPSHHLQPQPPRPPRPPLQPRQPQ